MTFTHDLSNLEMVHGESAIKVYAADMILIGEIKNVDFGQCEEAIANPETLPLVLDFARLMIAVRDQHEAERAGDAPGSA